LDRSGFKKPDTYPLPRLGIITVMDILHNRSESVWQISERP